MQKEAQKPREETAEVLENLERSKKIRKIFVIVIISVLLIIILFLGISTYFYFKTPEKTLGIGANIESSLLSVDGKISYLKLAGGSLDKNITKIKFIFTDENGNSKIPYIILSLLAVIILIIVIIIIKKKNKKKFKKKIGKRIRR